MCRRRPDKHAFVVRTEHFDSDAHELMKWLCAPEAEPPPKAARSDYANSDDTALTEGARATLRAHLAHEYYAKQTVERLSVNLAPSAPAVGAWARPPPLQDDRAQACVGACTSAPPTLWTTYDVSSSLLLQIPSSSSDASNTASDSVVSIILALSLFFNFGLAGALCAVRNKKPSQVKQHPETDEVYDMRPNDAAQRRAAAEQADVGGEARAALQES